MNAKPISWVRDGECIRCTSHALNIYGYPRMRRKNVQWPIARWILHRRLNGNLNPYVVTRHTCDNRWCINPNHILSGSNEDNVKDRVERGRTVHGEQQHCAKLNSVLVRVIRRLSGTMSERKIAKALRMGRQAIRKVILRQTWKHV